jgi:hypothetical protein
VAASTAAALVAAVSTLVVLAAQPLLAVADFTAERWQVADSMAVASTTVVTSTMGFTTGAALEATATTPFDYGYYDYGYPDYAYGDSYYDNGDCYVVQRRVHSRSGWHVRPVQVCS